VLRPRIEEVTVRFTVDGEEHAVAVYSDESALRALQQRFGRPRFPSSCEQGLCGTCETVVDGRPTRLCLIAAARLDGLSLQSFQPP
jgi:carbon-monoxide dehydrogenase small subunit